MCCFSFEKMISNFITEKNCQISIYVDQGMENRNNQFFQHMVWMDESYLVSNVKSKKINIFGQLDWIVEIANTSWYLLPTDLFTAFQISVSLNLLSKIRSLSILRSMLSEIDNWWRHNSNFKEKIIRMKLKVNLSKPSFNFFFDFTSRHRVSLTLYNQIEKSQLPSKECIYNYKNNDFPNRDTKK